MVLERNGRQQKKTRLHCYNGGCILCGVIKLIKFAGNLISAEKYEASRKEGESILSSRSHMIHT